MPKKGFTQLALVIILGIMILGAGFVAIPKLLRTQRQMPSQENSASPSPKPTPVSFADTVTIANPNPHAITRSSTDTSPIQSRGMSPKGIYALDSLGGVYRDSGIRNYDFVSGYAWRMGWADFEKEKDIYDFSAIDHIFSKLPEGQKLSLNMLGPGGTEPAYLAKTGGVTTWIYTDQNIRHENYGVPVEKPVPWDSYTQERFRKFAEKLAAHEVDGIPLRDHPDLAHIVIIFPGIGSIREGPGGAATPDITKLPGYTRKAFINAIINDLHALTDNFPSEPVSVPFFLVSDNTNSPPLWEEIHNAILVEFDGIKNKKVGYFQENLAAGSPSTAQKGPLTSAVGKTFITFQMLQSWVNPFTNPDKVKGNIPTDAIEHAYSSFGTTYFEVYVPDLDNKNWRDEFREWSGKLKK